MIELYTPNGLRAMVPENEVEDTTPRFNVENNLEDGVKYYKEKGYVIFDSCVSKENCNRLKNLWKEITKKKTIKILKPFNNIIKYKFI